jgi:hypothetical protein
MLYVILWEGPGLKEMKNIGIKLSITARQMKYPLELQQQIQLQHDKLWNCPILTAM